MDRAWQIRFHRTDGLKKGITCHPWGERSVPAVGMVLDYESKRPGRPTKVFKLRVTGVSSKEKVIRAERLGMRIKEEAR